MKKNFYLLLLIFIPLFIIFFAFLNPPRENLVKQSIPIFTILAMLYCLFTKDPRKGLLLFLAQVSMFEGPWKNFTYGTNLKLLVYIIRDLLLYITFLNFMLSRKRLLSHETLRERPPYSPIIVLFIFNIIIQIFNPGGYNLISSIAGSRLFWEMIPLYYMAFYIMRDKKSVDAMFWACVLFVFFNAVAAIQQYNWSPERLAKVAEGYRVLVYEWRRGFKQLVRPPGLGPDMGFAGYLFYSISPVIIALFFTISQDKKNKLKKNIMLMLLFLMMLIEIGGLIYSLSRTAVVLSVISAALYIWLVRKSINKIFFRVALAALLLWLLVPYVFSKVDVAMQRYESIKNPTQLVKTIFEDERGRFRQAFNYPLYYVRTCFFGRGLGRVGPGASIFSSVPPPEDTNTENTLNASLTEIGTIGVFLWLLFHIKVVKEGFRVFIYTNDTDWRWRSAAMLTCMVILLTQWQFGHLINFPNNAVFWFMSGSLMGLRNIKL